VGAFVKLLSWRATRVLGIVVTIVMATGVVYAAGYAIAPHSEAALTPIDRARLEVDFDLTPGAQRTEVYDSFNTQMGVLNTSIDREIVPYERIPDTVIEAVTAVEDENFFNHRGWDFRSTMRALLSNVSAGDISQGGSTITQQIVKLRVVGSERTLNRKIREAVLASRIEEELSKEELLEFYLNEIYFGNGAYGIQAAAETYYGKDVENLDHGEAALLAGLIRQPAIFDFFEDVDVAMRRREVGLTRLLDLDYINRNEFDRYLARPLPTRNLSPRFTDASLQRDYFLDEVVSAALDLEILGDTAEERFSAVYSGGLRIYSTYDPGMEQDMRDSVDAFFAEHGDRGQFEVSMATVEPDTGAIRAFIGGPDFADFEFNLATQGKRQPGSSFKTYVLTTAIERAGFLPYDTVSGLGPCSFDDGPQGLYTVNNFGHGPGRLGTIRTMTTSSSNCAFVRLGILSDLDEVVDVASRMTGREGDDRFLPFKSMSLGAQEVTPLEQAVGYAVLANGGVRMEPFYIERIEDRDGNVIYQHIPRGERIVSEATAALVTQILEANVLAGTGRRAQLSNGQASAGKTGTAQDFGDAWFVGYTPHYSTAVWIGDPTEIVSMRNLWGLSGVTGGRVPAPIFGDFMSKIHANLPLVEFPEPPPGPRSGRFLFLPDEKCDVEVELDDGTKIEFELDCADVRVDLEPTRGKFIPRDNALCEIQVTDEDGLTRNEKVRCSEVQERLNTTTTTTEEETTTTSEGDGGGTTTAPGDGTTTTTAAASTTTTGSTTTTAPTTTTTAATTTTTTAATATTAGG